MPHAYAVEPGAGVGGDDDLAELGGFVIDEVNDAVEVGIVYGGEDVIQDDEGVTCGRVLGQRQVDT